MGISNQINRREFMSKATLAIGGILSTAMAIPALAYIVGPALKKAEEQHWIPLGNITKIEVGTPTLFKATVQRESGWIVDEERLMVYILTDDSREYIAMSNICTHLGCRVRWIADREQFYCPCHDGIFDKQGNVVSGPPPRPLDRYDAEVENDQLLILVN